MPFERGRMGVSSEGEKSGITLLVPRAIIDNEQNQVMQMLLDARVQQLIIFLRRGHLRHLNINERLRKGQYKGFTPLHVAVMRGTSSVVAALLELAKADANVPASGTHETALHLAAAKGDVGMTRALLEHGATADSHEAHRLTPLLVASSAGMKGSFHHLVAAELIKARASLTARDPQGDTPIHLACDTLLALPLVNELCGGKAANGRGSIAGLGDALEALNHAGEGVLHRAIARKQPEVAKLLLRAGARPDARSGDGDTAMHCAARAGLDEIAQILLGAPNLALDAANLAGETPLHLAMSGGTAAHAKVARMLLSSGAFAFGRTRNGESVLHACAREGNDVLAKTILMRSEDARKGARAARCASVAASTRAALPLWVDP